MAVVNKIPELLEKLTPLDAAQRQAKQWVTDNSAFLAKLLKEHQALIKDQKIGDYQALYDGDMLEIDLREKSRGDDVNHKVYASLAQLVVDTPVDYLLGKPIVWSMKDPQEAGTTEKVMDEYRKELLALLESEDAQRVLRELLKQGGIAGMGALISWVDEDGKIDYDEFPIQEVVPVFDVRGRLRLVVRFYEVDLAAADAENPDMVYMAEIYDGRYVITAVGNADATEFTYDETEPVVEHKAARIPVTVFMNGTPARYKERKKKAGVSDLAGNIQSLITEYAQAISDKANAVDRMQDELLLMTGVQLPNGTKGEAEVLAMRKARALALKNENSAAQFIHPTQEDQAVENFLNRVRDTIYATAFLPKLDDLSGASATEIKTKYAGLDIKAGMKETYFKAAIKSLLSILTDFLNAKKLAGAGGLPEDYHDKLKEPGKNGLYSSEWVEFTLNRNIPQNYLEIAQIVATLTDKVPDSYLYELLWFIPDPQDALDEMRKQREEAQKRSVQAGLDAMGLGGDMSDTQGGSGSGQSSSGGSNSAGGMGGGLGSGQAGSAGGQGQQAEGGKA